MLRIKARNVASLRKYCCNPPKFKVAIVGSSGGIGQPLSLLLKLNTMIKQLNLYDMVLAKGVSYELDHIETDVVVKGFEGECELLDALKGMDVVMIPAGLPRKPGMSREDLFGANAGIAKAIAEAISEACPKALVGVITNPVNSIVPVMSEVMKKKCKYDPRRIFGVTTLDVVRANTMVAKLKGMNPRDLAVPVVGGHSGSTIIPLLSQVKVPCPFTCDEIKKLTSDIQNAGTEVVVAKGGKGSATLSMAYSAARFANALIRALSGDTEMMEYTYVASTISPAPYFATRVLLGKNGVEQVCPLGELSAYEKASLEIAIPELKNNIQEGIDYVEKSQD